MCVFEFVESRRLSATFCTSGALPSPRGIGGVCYSTAQEHAVARVRVVSSARARKEQEQEVGEIRTPHPLFVPGALTAMTPHG